MYNTIYPGYNNPYPGINNQIVKRKEDEEKSQSSRQNEDATQQQPKKYSNNQFPNGQNVSIDYSKPSVNIAQIVADFKNTTMAIGAPQDVGEEVLAYLNLIENQANKPEPNGQIIKANLKNASQILDKYITEALNKPSKVVENWIDALFLQKIDYKADTEAINPDFKVNIPPKKAEPQAVQITETEPVAVVQTQSETLQVQTNTEKQDNPGKKDIYIPEDKQLRRFFIQAKKYASINADEKSIAAFKQTLRYATEIGDTQAQSMIYYEVGKIYDKNDYLPEAIKSYQQAIERTNDNNIKARSHINMGQIYDDVVQYEPAVDHYFAAVSFAGETENLRAQTKALTNLANMHCNRYDKQKTFEFIDLATGIAEETRNNKVIASTYNKSADMSERLDENAKALEFYKESTRYYSKIEAIENVVRNYQNASGVMMKLGDKTKAKTLLQKAYVKGQSVSDANLLTEISQQLTRM